MCYAESLHLPLTLCDLMDCSPPGSSVRGILCSRILERVAMTSSRGSSQPRVQTLMFSAPAGGFFTTSGTWEVLVCVCTVSAVASGLSVDMWVAYRLAQCTSSA